MSSSTTFAVSQGEAGPAGDFGIKGDTGKSGEKVGGFFTWFLNLAPLYSVLLHIEYDSMSHNTHKT